MEPFHQKITLLCTSFGHISTKTSYSSAIQHYNQYLGTPVPLWFALLAIPGVVLCGAGASIAPPRGPNNILTFVHA